MAGWHHLLKFGAVVDKSTTQLVEANPLLVCHCLFHAVRGVVVRFDQSVNEKKGLRSYLRT